MTAGLTSMQEAYEDLQRRSLSKIPCNLGRLIYLASTRDYNSGSYHHEGLAMRFDPDAARKALEVAHRQVFYELSASSLEGLTAELEAYMKSSLQSPSEVLRTWQKLEPYRIAIPMDVNPIVARLFLSNIKLALAILQHHRQQNPELRQDA
jgi:hypothetical protein